MRSNSVKSLVTRVQFIADDHFPYYNPPAGDVYANGNGQYGGEWR